MPARHDVVEGRRGGRGRRGGVTFLLGALSLEEERASSGRNPCSRQPPGSRGHRPTAFHLFLTKRNLVDLVVSLSL